MLIFQDIRLRSAFSDWDNFWMSLKITGFSAYETSRIIHMRTLYRFRNANNGLLAVNGQLFQRVTPLIFSARYFKPKTWMMGKTFWEIKQQKTRQWQDVFFTCFCLCIRPSCWYLRMPAAQPARATKLGHKWGNSYTLSAQWPWFR